MRSFRRHVTALLIGAFVAAVPVAAQQPRVIALRGDDSMKFSVTEIPAKPGELLKIRLTSTGTIPKEVMAHNFVLLKPGTDLNAFVMAAVMARDAGYIPASLKGQILANTSLAGPGETVEVTFTAPKMPGKYQFICSFAGHFQAGMTGVLVVK